MSDIDSENHTCRNNRMKGGRCWTFLERDFEKVPSDFGPITEEEARNAVELPNHDDVRKFFK